MELTLDQALQKGIEAHKAGQVQEADRLYTAILKAQPKHPDANHNLGLLAVLVNKADAALPLFKTAIEANPTIEQFWLSYIQVLIRFNMIDDAREEIKKCKEIGHKSEEVDRLNYRLEPSNLKQSVVSAVEQFYQDIPNRVLSDAAVGWLFADSFDKHFMSANPVSKTPKKKKYFRKNKSDVSTNEKIVLQCDASKIIKKINSEKSIFKKYDYLKKLINSDDVNLVNDSFKGEANADLGCAIEKTFNSVTVNLVIIGGGVCGLFLANGIKNRFGNRANVLVLDNRSRHSNTREPFKREWLTHIATKHFKIGKPTNILPLLECFGTNGLIGIPINILETILQLSCKDQGVKFLFLETFDYSDLNNNVIDLVFDATGGRLKECSYSASNSAELALNIPKRKFNLNYAGVKQLHNIPGVGADYLDVVLKPFGDFHEPYIGNSKICVHMVKITSIPINLMQTILEAVKKLNSLNTFYVWNGVLRDEINEGLILINLLDKESWFLNSIINDRITLKALLGNNSNILNYLNRNINNIFQMLVGLDVDSQVKIEKPFKFCPYVNLNPGFGLLSGKRVFAVGDSLFCGHPKKGNGLGKHLSFINDLLEKMTQH